ncbi:hypothetical protein G714_04285 [Escherichia coli HVH 39 (4-2679949)]|uniref:hypothetical protein n=1 Tax=Escherichia coli TaxID=562 RepID=UPI0003903108|nr:hypothetical protein [Escherichia coli]EQO38505.1 hypothetical protein G714_04285 [Escherichia coli HVH 39 (4-2679949)]
MKNEKRSTFIFIISYYLFIIVGCIYLRLNPDYHFLDNPPLPPNSLLDNILSGFIFLAIILMPLVFILCAVVFSKDKPIEQNLLNYYKLKLKEMNALESKYFENTEALNKLNEKKSFLNTEIGYIAHACALVGNVSIDEAKELINDESITTLTLQGNKPWLHGLLSFVNSEYSNESKEDS